MSTDMSGGLEMYFTDWNRLSFLQFCPGTRLTEVNVCTASKRYKKGTFSLQKVTYPYVHELCTIFLINKFLKKKNHQGQHPEVRLSFSLK